MNTTNHALHIGGKVTSIPHLLLAFMEGDHAGAFFVRQLLYYVQQGLTYSDSETGDNWRIMEPDEWQAETFCTYAQISSRIKKYDFIESVYKKSPFDRHDYPSGKGRKALNWYRINIDLFNEQFGAWLLTQENLESVTHNKVVNQDSQQNDESDDSQQNDESLIRDHKNEKEDGSFSFFELIKSTMNACNKTFDDIKIQETAKQLKEGNYAPDDMKLLAQWIIDSEWANKHPRSFLSADYLQSAKDAYEATAIKPMRRFY